MQSELLIIDDDQAFSTSVASLAQSEGFTPHLGRTIAQGRDLLRCCSPDLLLLDLHLPDGSGLDLLPDIDRDRPGRVAVLTGSANLQSAASLIGTTVNDYLIKPCDPDVLVTLLRACRRPDLAPGHEPLPGVLAVSAAMREPVQLARVAAPTDATVLLAGETGTGKEMFARAIHQLSGRAGRFVALNCGAVPSELLASTLFGHERGSFTGAVQRHAGVFEQAQGGTLFLDEITEMPAELQVYLLRALETGTVQRVGGQCDVPVHARIVAATNREPHDAVAQGRLREDLYYRLADLTITLPALRQRPDDVAVLAEHFLRAFNGTYGTSHRLSSRSLRALRLHSWPGNVRELRSVLHRAVLLAQGDEVTVVFDGGRTPPALESEHMLSFAIGTPWAEMERRTLLKVLEHCNNDKSAAARLLGVSARTVHNHVARLRKTDDT